MDGNEFFYFIDGSGQELKAATKIVTVTQHTTYKLVFANYYTEMVEVYLTYDINIYPITSETSPEEPKEAPLWQSAIFLAPIILVVGILIGLIGSNLVRSRKGEEVEEEDEIDEEDEVAEEMELSKRPVESGEEPEVTEKPPSPSFCGHCGKPVKTQFCPYCGKEAQRA